MTFKVRVSAGLNQFDMNSLASITKAACDTGGTISAAGMIMILVFGGMLISDMGTVNQV